MSNILNAVRTAQPSADIATISILDIQSEFQFDELRFAHHNKSGNDYLQLVNGDSWIPVRIGDKASVTKEGDELAQMRHLINNNVIFTGESTNGTWFTFGQKGTMKATKVVKFSDLVAAGKISALAGAPTM